MNVESKPSHIFSKREASIPASAFCGDGSAPRQVTDEDVIPCSDGWRRGRETIFHCTITALPRLDSLPEHPRARCLPETCSHSTTISLA